MPAESVRALDKHRHQSACTEFESFLSKQDLRIYSLKMNLLLLPYKHDKVLCQEHVKSLQFFFFLLEIWSP